MISGDGSLVALLQAGIYYKPDTIRTPDQSCLTRHICTYKPSSDQHIPDRFLLILKFHSLMQSTNRSLQLSLLSGCTGNVILNIVSGYIGTVRYKEPSHNNRFWLLLSILSGYTGNINVGPHLATLCI